jgi:DNA replication and repair protein RecF
MYVRAIELATFRGWKSLRVDFDARTTVLLGGNGVGKTSVLEAAWYVASLSSHRTATDATMVSQDERAAVVRAFVERGSRTETVELEIVTSGRARAKLGGASVSRRRDVLGVIRASIFAPERVAVIREDPSDRRRFADELLVQLHPRYHAVIREYERALRQRNTLLREHAAGRRPLTGLEAWDESLVAPGAELAAGRARSISLLAPHARTAFEAVGGGTSFDVSYLPNVPQPAEPSVIEGWADSMRERLEARRQDEVIRGVTLVGPHRDDLTITLGGMPARTHASHGEGWLAALALVLGAHRTLADASGEEPLLLLDDPFTLLDPERRARLVEALPADGQIIATAADPNEVPPGLDAATIDVTELRGG